MWLNFLYTVQLVISDVCTNFKILGQVVPDEKFNIYYIGVRDEKRKTEKEGKNKSQHLGFVFGNTFGCPHRVYKI